MPMMQDDPESLLKLLELHFAWYPLVELRDVYKLLYQGAMGSEHLLTSSEEFTRYLRDEFERLQPDPSQRFLEPVRPDGTLVRLNLHAYKSRQVSVDLLISSLLETAHLITGTQSELRVAWLEFVQCCHHGQVSKFDTSSVDQFSQRLEELEYPAMHHSEIYHREYQPAYRLISTWFIPMLGMTDAG